MSKKDKLPQLRLKDLPEAFQPIAALQLFSTQARDQSQIHINKEVAKRIGPFMDTSNDWSRAELAAEHPDYQQAKSIAEQEQELHEQMLTERRNAERRLEELHKLELQRLDRLHHGQRPRPQQPTQPQAQPQPAPATVTP